MKDILEKLITALSTSPYLYILIFVLILIPVASVLLIVFRKSVSAWLKNHFTKSGQGIEITRVKKDTIAINAKDASSEIHGVELAHVEMEFSKLGSVKGNVKLKDVKLKGSEISSIGSKE